jgi:uncharacterized glyoxalase superfamily protein PhnB
MYHPERCTPVLIVDRVEPTRDFFHKRLGWPVLMEVPHGETIGFAQVELGPVAIMIQPRASVAEDLNLPFESVNLSNTTLYIEIDDVEQVVSALEGLDVVVPLRKTWYGMHEISVREPGGNIIGFASKLPTPTA